MKKRKNIQKILQKKIKTHIWSAIDEVNLILYIIDSSKYNYQDIESDINKISDNTKSIALLVMVIVEGAWLVFSIQANAKEITLIEERGKKRHEREMSVYQ